MKVCLPRHDNLRLSLGSLVFDNADCDQNRAVKRGEGVHRNRRQSSKTHHALLYLLVAFFCLYLLRCLGKLYFFNDQFIFQQAFTVRENVESSQMEKPATRLFNDY